MNITETNRHAVWAKTACVGFGSALSVWLMYFWMLSRGVALGGLYLPFAFLIVQTGAIMLLLTGSFSSKRVNQVRTRLSERLDPLLREKLALYAAGMGTIASMQRLNRRFPRNVEQSVVEFLSSLTGEPQTRMSKLTEDLGLVAKWENNYRHRGTKARRLAVSRLGLVSGAAGQDTLVSALNDKDVSVRINAARALLRSKGTEEIERVFHFASGPSLLIRVILAEALRPHALLLCDRAIPAGLRSEDPKTALRTMEFVEAWQGSLPLPGLNTLLKHSDAAVRAKALRMLPHNSTEQEIDADIMLALDDEDAGVRAAAAFATAKMGVQAALPGLVARLRDDIPAVVRAAANALAEMGPEGLKALEDEVFFGTCPTIAMEALESAGMDR